MEYIVILQTIKKFNRVIYVESSHLIIISLIELIKFT